MTDLAARLAAVIDPTRIRTDTDSLQQYGRDWTRYYAPAASAVVFPRSLGEVQALVQLARAERLALVPSGGRTGLSGGACAVAGEVVVSFEQMREISDFDPVAATVRCQAGVVTESLQQYALAQGLYFPVDFASRGSSCIGGNIATNAGGIKVVRYGMFRDWVAGLTVVTGAGDVLRLNQGLVKNNSGYDLRHLFVGSEGTLGLIVDATLRLARAPAPARVMVCAAPALEHILQVFHAFRARLTLNAFEFFSEAAQQAVLARGHVRRAVDTVTPYYALLEFDAEHESAALAAFEACVDAGWLADGVISQSDTQAAALWRLREDISESITPRTPYKNDVSVVISRAPAFIAELDALLAREYPDFDVVWFGHIGDGNLHINVLRPLDMDIDTFRGHCERVNSLVFDVLARYQGSMSAEHGVGLLKRDYLPVTRSAEEIHYLRGIRQVFDPDGILNPGKLLPAAESA